MKKTDVFKPGTIPTRDQLFKAMADPEAAFAQEQLNNLLNQPPHNDWIKPNNGMEYLPIDKVEFLLTYIFQVWKREILREGIMLNSVFAVVRLHVCNPITKEWTFHDGAGAVPVQLDKGSKASDLSQLKGQSIQMNLPAAVSYALSNAAGCYGKIFGRDLNRKDTLQYIGGFNPEEKEENKPGGVQTEQLKQMEHVPANLNPIVSQKVNIEL